MLAPFGVEIVSAGELGLPAPDETGTTFEANATIKALAADARQRPAGAGRRFGPQRARARRRARRLHRRLGRPDARRHGRHAAHPGRARQARRARHRCRAHAPPSIACWRWPGPTSMSSCSTARSTAASSGRRAAAAATATIPASSRSATARTTAEMSDAEKNAISHRGRAFAQAGRGLLPMTRAQLRWASTSTGRSASRSAPTATSTAMCATASSRRAGARRCSTELEHAAREAPDRRVETMFFGGGTPSLMAPETVGALIARTRALWDTARRCRDHARSQPDLGRGRRLRRAGRRPASTACRWACRRSMPTALRFLGREHSADEALAALETARRHFARYSFDLIYARPGQTPEAWARRARARARRSPASICRSTSSPSSAARASSPSTRAAPSCCPTRKRPARDVRADPGAARRGRAAGLRDLQPCAAGRSLPP